MKFLLTGATGFIGRHVLKLYLEHGHEILIISRRNEPKKQSSNVTWITADLSDSGTIEEAVRQFNPEAVLHLAWEGIPDFSFSQTLKNFNSTLQLFTVLKACSACRLFAMAGSCWEYGALTGQVDENQAPLHPSFFAATKTALYQMLSAAGRDHKIDVIAGRIFFVFGEGQRNEALIPSVVRSLKEDEPLVLNNPHAAQDFIHIDDVSRALYLLTKSPNIDPGIYNIGSGKLHTVAEVVSICRKQIRSLPELERPMASPNGMFADITKMKLLNWLPQISLEQGIAMYLGHL